MNPITHFLTGWVLANAANLNRRERALVTAAGVIPDIDGAGILAEVLTSNSDHPLLWWSEYHHMLGHNLVFGIMVTAGVLAAHRKWKIALLAFLSFHLHLFEDLIGARGPDDYQWPIPYFYPFSKTFELTWSGQWALNAWPNFLITGILLASTFYLAWKRAYSPLEMISSRADKIFVMTLRNRVPYKESAES